MGFAVSQGIKTENTELWLSQLAELRAKMQKAFEYRQWQDLADLDNDCRSVVTQLIGQADASVLAALKETLSFYSHLIKDCRYQKNEVAVEAISMRQSRASGHTYHQMNHLR
tara:strand:- start:77359 stop:77694 length:336 start_codon:yes stop_codon:yes gene_type:complete